MNEVERILMICRELRLPSGQWVINGSGVLALHGIERDRPMGDLDIFCSTIAWFNIFEGDHVIFEHSEPGPEMYIENPTPVHWRLKIPSGIDSTQRCDPPVLTANMHGLKVDLSFQWRRRENQASSFDPAQYIKSADVVRGVACVPLGFIIGWKLGMNRDKDLRDVLAIRKFMGREKLEDR